MQKEKLKIGSRASKLALWQAAWVAGQIEASGGHCEIVKIKTTGDKILDVPLAKVGGKGLFVKEIEEALITGEIDLAVHSMKDMPGHIPSPLHLAAISKRENPQDVLISRLGLRFFDLSAGSKIGTSALRRQAQLMAHRSDLQFVPLRGNLDTRLRKLKEGQLDAIILAAAGLHRMGWDGQVTEYLPFEISLPAIGQGALGIECRRNDREVNAYVAMLNDSETARCVTAERAMLKRLEGGCQVPIAGIATLSQREITLKGLVASLDGKEIIHVCEHGDEPESLGIRVAELLLSRGADRILAAIYPDNPQEKGPK